MDFEKSQAYDEAERETQFSKLTDEMEGVKSAYELHMELQGPVLYWRGRGREHLKSAKNMGWILIVYSVVAIGVLYFLFDRASSYLPEAGKDIPIAALFKLGAFTLLVTTVAVWIGKVLLRIYLSDRHIAIDAAERRTMIMTYLALTKKKAVEEKDRNLILAAIFRPGADGIVKEDSAPDTAFATIVANLLKGGKA